jgi:HTH-type transcriptional regulator/antitoxin MqsA
MMNELDTVVLTTDLPEHSLKAGDLGTVVLVHRHGGYEVEFTTLDGETVAVVSLSSDQVRPVGRREIAHARLVTTE